jgi:hypothetical protein
MFIINPAINLLLPEYVPIKYTLTLSLTSELVLYFIKWEQIAALKLFMD